MGLGFECICVQAYATACHKGLHLQDENLEGAYPHDAHHICIHGAEVLAHPPGWVLPAGSSSGNVHRALAKSAQDLGCTWDPTAERCNTGHTRQAAGVRCHKRAQLRFMHLSAPSGSKQHLREEPRDFRVPDEVRGRSWNSAEGLRARSPISRGPIRPCCTTTPFHGQARGGKAAWITWLEACWELSKASKSGVSLSSW